MVSGDFAMQGNSMHDIDFPDRKIHGATMGPNDAIRVSLLGLFRFQSQQA